MDFGVVGWIWSGFEEFVDLGLVETEGVDDHPSDLVDTDDVSSYLCLVEQPFDHLHHSFASHLLAISWAVLSSEASAELKLIFGDALLDNPFKQKTLPVPHVPQHRLLKIVVVPLEMTSDVFITIDHISIFDIVPHPLEENVTQLGFD